MRCTVLECSQRNWLQVVIMTQHNKIFELLCYYISTRVALFVLKKHTRVSFQTVISQSIIRAVSKMNECIEIYVSLSHLTPIYHVGLVLEKR